MYGKISRWGLFLSLLLFLGGSLPSPAGAIPDAPVYVIPVTGTVDANLAGLVERGLAQAQEGGAAAVVLELDTPGGLVEQAINIKNAIHRTPLETIAYVKEQAISAGVLIALAADHLVMAPGTTIGAAEPRLGTQPADEKTISWWSGVLATAAQEHGRREDIARAMADIDVAIPGLVEKGKLLTLTDRQAAELGWIDGIATSQEDLLAQYGLAPSPVVEVKPTAAETLGRWLANPYLATLLLLVGMAGIVIELLTAGFGLAGTIGVMAMALYLGGSLAAGFGNWLAIVLVVLGIVLMLLEVLVIPGFGVAGIGGIGAVVAGLILVAPTVEQGLISLAVAGLGTVALALLSLRLLPGRRWHGLVLETREETRSGYSSAPPGYQAYLDRKGTALTPLRPAGIMLLAGGERLDVVAEGAFITRGTPVKIVKIEGNRVIVRPITQANLELQSANLEQKGEEPGGD